MSDILQIKITLKNTKPPIWRRVQIEDTSTFADLHEVIRDAMGWDGSHLHGFTFESQKPRKITLISKQDEESIFDNLDEDQTKVADWLGKKSQQCTYTYDFGDNWEHLVLLEKVLPADQTQKYPRCVAGKRACPPDDCGGMGATIIT